MLALEITGQLPTRSDALDAVLLAMLDFDSPYYSPVGMATQRKKSVIGMGRLRAPVILALAGGEKATPELRDHVVRILREAKTTNYMVRPSHAEVAAAARAAGRLGKASSAAVPDMIRLLEGTAPSYQSTIRGSQFRGFTGEPTTPRLELIRTLGAFGSDAKTALPVLQFTVAADWSHIPRGSGFLGAHVVEAEQQAAREAIARIEAESTRE
jgi:hypothetical protein